MAARWSTEKANNWYRKLPWLVGCNFIPSTAINQLEMFQKKYFDAATIDRELGWAAKLGFNTMRVYLHDLLWEADQEGFKKTLDKYLSISSKHGISTLFTVFDDCWDANPKLGKQRKPAQGTHNSGWVQSPGSKIVNDTKHWGRLERYVKGLLRGFGEDERVIFWDLYNEPGNRGQSVKSLPLLKKVFEWAREAGPSQPLTSGVHSYEYYSLNSVQLNESDIITFHKYDTVNSLRKDILELKALERPVICTEYMARTRGSTFETQLPVFKSEKVGCYNWGLVSGKTNTIFQWGKIESEKEPLTWFHDILRRNGTPYSKYETDFLKAFLKDKKIF